MLENVANRKFETIEYLNALRAMATIAVVFYHCGPGGESDILIYQLISLFCNWCVPIFIMITGCIFLDLNKSTSMCVMIKKYITRILLVLLIWGFVYNSISNSIIYGFSSDSLISSLKMVVSADTTFCYQFWYLYLLVGLYACIPFLKPWIRSMNYQSKFDANSMLIFWGIVSIILPTALNIIGYEGTIWKGAFTVFSAWQFYLVCGYLIHKYEIPKIIWRGLLFSLLIQMLFFILKIAEGRFCDIRAWYGYTSFFTWNFSVILFQVFKNKFNSDVHGIVKYIVDLISKYSFGIYIFHVMILFAIGKIGFIDQIIDSWVYPLCVVPITVVVCIFITAILKKIPLLQRLV
jgi:surface polysaccharide O-acyltransferase-like enzyme